MNTEKQIKALAELDGWKYYENPQDNTHCFDGKHRWFNTSTGCCYHKCEPSYLTSYDAIIPLIQKQTIDIKIRTHNWVLQLMAIDMHRYDVKPAQLCEALLRATGKWEE